MATQRIAAKKFAIFVLLATFAAHVSKGPQPSRHACRVDIC
jgi:hypothetical protein